MNAEQPSDAATEAKENDPAEKDAETKAEAAGEEEKSVDTKLTELTADLQRVTAEYHNYRKRVERDKALAAEQVTASVVSGLLPVLDDIDRARDHDDLDGPFAGVAEQLNNSLVKLGLQIFGEKGDAFDPTIHEAVAHMHSPDVTEASCVDVMRRGYRIGDRLIRPAMVAVAEPAEPVVAESGTDFDEAKTEEAAAPSESAEAGDSNESAESNEPAPNDESETPESGEKTEPEATDAEPDVSDDTPKPDDKPASGGKKKKK